jgi:hypothetical protein
MSQNVWATIMPFGPVSNFLLTQKIFFWASLSLALISGTDDYDWYNHVPPLLRGARLV